MLHMMILFKLFIQAPLTIALSGSCSTSNTIPTHLPSVSHERLTHNLHDPDLYKHFYKTLLKSKPSAKLSGKQSDNLSNGNLHSLVLKSCVKRKWETVCFASLKIAVMTSLRNSRGISFVPLIQCQDTCQTQTKASQQHRSHLSKVQHFHPSDFMCPVF